MRSLADRVAELHAAGLAASEDGRPAVAAREFRRGLRLLGAHSAGADPALAELHGRTLVSLAWAESERGRVDSAFRLLDEAEAVVPASYRGVLFGQRAVLLARAGRNELAVQEFDAAIAVLDEQSAPLDLVKALNNRSLLHLEAARVGPARADLQRCARIAARHGFALVAAVVRVNLGCLDVLAGDIPAALQAFGAARQEYQSVAPGRLPALAVERARALLGAGLFREADRELAGALEEAAGQRLSFTRADALLVRAEAALLAGRSAAAARWARQAGSCFLGRDNPRRAALAALLELRADQAASPAGAGSAMIAERALALGVRLGRLGLPEDARVAGLLAARALAAAGQLGRAERAASRHRTPGRSDRLDTRLLWRLTRAELATAAGRPAEASRHLAAGMTALHRYRSQFGCLDLQTGAAVHGRDLAQAGLRGALAAGSIAAVYRWSERARAQALRLPPVRPPADPAAAAALEDLRRVRHSLREAELAGRPAGGLRARAEALQRTIREHSWSAAGPGLAAAAAPVPLAAVKVELGDAALVSYLRDGAALQALVVTGGSAVVLPVGNYPAAEEALLRLRADLDAQAGRTLQRRLAAAVAAATRRDAAAVAAAVLDPVLPLIGDRDLVVIPTGLLVTVPWAMLPGCRHRPVTVTPSATAWLAARRGADRAGSPGASGACSAGGSGVSGADQAGGPGASGAYSAGGSGALGAEHAGGLGCAAPGGRAGSALLVAGPGNDRGAAEVREIAALHPHATVLTGAAANPAAALAALDGAAVAHLAAHGHHDGDNALFSALELTGGPLLGYDLQRLSRPPPMVVLSSCDLGLADVRPGDETIGMATALLAAGSATVIASVSRVADETAMAVMTSHHRAIGAGRAPAAALAAASAADPTAGFVCFGAG